VASEENLLRLKRIAKAVGRHGVEVTGTERDPADRNKTCGIPAAGGSGCA